MNSPDPQEETRTQPDPAASEVPNGAAAPEAGADSPLEHQAGDLLPKHYDPATVELATYRRWEEAGYFTADPQRVLSGEKEPFCIVLPPPNVTGRLHLGHALDQTIMDVLVRWHRMRGFETLWLPGMDHAGIATQNVVEKQEERGRTRKLRAR